MKQSDTLVADSDSHVGQGRYNCPVGLDSGLGPSAIPRSSPPGMQVVAGSSPPANMQPVPPTLVA